ncbi:hypothetical protein D3C74_29950 [compost metagenome]
MGIPIIYLNGSALSLKNPKIKLVQRINNHAKLHITAVLTGEEPEKYVEAMDTGAGLMLSYQDDDDKRMLLFKGLISQVRIKMVADVAHLVAEAVSYTIKLDEETRSRSFQNKNMTYKALLDKVLARYKEANCTHPLRDENIQHFTLQYDETDWEFLKRMASRFGWGLIPDPLTSKQQFYFGLPDGTQKGKLSSYNYSVTRKAEPNDSNLLYYKVQTKGMGGQRLGIGDETQFRNMTLWVLQSSTIIRHSAIWYEYVLTTKEGMQQELILNDNIRGMTLKSKVIGLEQDHVKVFFYEIDKEKPVVAETHAFPYATFYTSEGNTGWYCMPELFDFVDVYFPSNKEQEAIITHSIRRRSKGGDFIKDPAVKLFMTKYRKAIIFDQHEILITGQDDEVVIRLLDDHGIELRSTKDIRVKADGTLSLKAGNTVQITAKDAIGLKCKTSLLEMDGNVSITGAKVNIQ